MLMIIIWIPTLFYPTTVHHTYPPTYLLYCIHLCVHVLLCILTTYIYHPIICNICMCARHFFVGVYYLPFSENSYSYGLRFFIILFCKIFYTKYTFCSYFFLLFLKRKRSLICFRIINLIPCSCNTIIYIFHK